jgi:hypothetical protein
VCVLVIVGASIVGIVALARDDGRSVRIATPAGETSEVAVDQLPRASTNLFLYFALDATDEQIGQVRAVLDSSPDVVHYAFLDHDAAQSEFAQLYACHPDLVQLLGPHDLPESFRVSTVDANAATRLQVALGNAPGGALVTLESSMYPIPARSDQTASSDFPAPCVGNGENAQVAPTVPVLAPSGCSTGATPPDAPVPGCIRDQDMHLSPPEMEALYAAQPLRGVPVYDKATATTVIGYMTDTGFIPSDLVDRYDDIKACNQEWSDLIHEDRSIKLSAPCRSLLLATGVSPNVLDFEPPTTAPTSG